MAVVLTVTGQNKFAAALGGGDPVTFAEFAVGDGNGDYYTLDENQTALINETWRGDVNRVYVDPTNLDQVVVETLIPAGVGGWTIREAGLFDAVGDLIAIALYPLTEKPAPGSGSEKEIYARIVLQITNGGSVVIEISPDLTMATLQDLADHEAKQLDPADTDTVKEKHLSNAQANVWEASIAANAQDIIDSQAAITAEATARGDADTTLQDNIDAEAAARDSADTAHAGLTSAHGATSAATPSRIMMRDASGRAKVAAPSAADDIARKNEVDTHAALTSPHGASAAATASRLALRDASGRLEAVSGISGNDLVNFSQFANSKGSSGYQYLPNGLILQWGQYNSIGTDATVTITFPLTFPTTCLQSFAGYKSGLTVSNAADSGLQMTPISQSQATLVQAAGAGGPYTVSWFAIGY